MLAARSGTACAADREFAQWFVLWAAEWWRRSYDGSNISWTPMLAALDCPADVWTHDERSDCVFKGLQRWGRRLHLQRGFHYILTIALEGGLPLRLLAEGRGGLGKLLKRVLTQTADSRAGKEEIRGWVESLKEMLPNSYRQPVVFMLLADIIAAVLDLKREAGLTGDGNVIEILDRHDPKWRERFPLPLEDEHAQGLLAQLFEESVEKGRDRQSASPFVLERSLEENGQNWRVSATLPLPEALEQEKLAEFFSIAVDALPRQTELTLRAGEKERGVTVRRMVGQGRYRMLQQFADMLDAAAIREHTLEFELDEGQTASAPVAQGMELDEDLPWIFSAESGRRFLGQGDGKTGEAELLLAIPESWPRPVEEEGGVCASMGELPFCRRAVWRVRGSIRVTDAQGEQFRIGTGSRDAGDGPDFVWRGERLWYGFLNPARAFRGIPKLYAVNAQGIERKVGGNLVSFQALGTKKAAREGPVSGMYSAGTSNCRARMVLLPREARMEIRGHDAHSGEISLRHWGVVATRSLTEAVRMRCENGEDTAVLHCSTTDGAQAPEQVELELFWPHTPTPARLKLPFPARGARAFGMDGAEWKTNTRISLNQLLGARMIVATRPHDHISFELRPVHGGTGRSRFHVLKPEARSFQLTIHLQRYEEEARQLLAMSDEPNAAVRLLLIVNGIESFQVDIHRYAGYLVVRAGNTGVAPDPLSLRVLGRETCGAIRLQACNLAAESDSVVDLGRMSEAGLWPFSRADRAPGPWLLFPAPDSPVLLSPLLINIGGPSGAKTALAKAMSLPDEDERMRSLALTVKKLADDYLDETWVEVDQWADQIGHLALQSFDLWRAFARSAPGMAALAFRLGKFPEPFVRRFALELPFAWNLLGFADWKTALANLKEQCAKILPPEQQDAVFRFRLDSAIRWIAEDRPELAGMLDIAASCFQADKKGAVKTLLREVGPNAADTLFAGDDSRVQQLVRRHPEDVWPDGAACRDMIGEAKGDPRSARYLFALPFPAHMQAVINLPLLLAARCADGSSSAWLGDPVLVRTLKECRAFDPEWFETAYNYTVARCLADGLLDLNE